MRNPKILVVAEEMVGNGQKMVAFLASLEVPSPWFRSVSHWQQLGLPTSEVWQVAILHDPVVTTSELWGNGYNDKPRGRGENREERKRGRGSSLATCRADVGPERKGGLKEKERECEWNGKVWLVGGEFKEKKRVKEKRKEKEKWK